jgi:hypothetical protein
MAETKDKVTGASTRGFTAAADAAAGQIGDNPGTWKATAWEVEIEHHSPSHVQVYRVTLEKGGRP